MERNKKMASINWMKATTQKAGAMKKHLGKIEREKGNHSNPNINIFLSKQNYTIGCNDYTEALEMMKARTKEVDMFLPPKRIRKDRVTCCFLELPCPREITEQGKSDEFFFKAHQLYEEFFGKENTHGTFVHKDEIHEYTAKDGGTQTSLEHAHTLVSAFAEGKGINGKAFETRAKIKALNTTMNEMCMREFGISLNNGETPQRKSVETLKQESEVRQELVELNKRIRKLQQVEQESRDRFLKTDEKATEAESRLKAAQKQASIAEQQKITAENKLQEVNSQIVVANKELKKTLDKKVKAAKIPSLNPFSETVTYHKNTLESVQRIGNEAYNNLTKANETMQQAITIQMRAERKEQEIEPLYREANNDRVIASQELKRAKELREKQEQLIKQKAEELAETRVLQGMRGIATNRNQRLEAFCRELKFTDGTTALEEFEKQERELERQALERTRGRNQGLER